MIPFLGLEWANRADGAGSHVEYTVAQMNAYIPIHSTKAPPIYNFVSRSGADDDEQFSKCLAC